MNIRKILGVVLLIFIFFFIVQSPASAAAIARDLGHGLSHMFNQLSEFMRRLA
jgi:hypothetical protein